MLYKLEMYYTIVNFTQTFMHWLSSYDLVVIYYILMTRSKTIKNKTESEKNSSR